MIQVFGLFMLKRLFWDIIMAQNTVGAGWSVLCSEGGCVGSNCDVQGHTGNCWFWKGCCPVSPMAESCSSVSLSIFATSSLNFPVGGPWDGHQQRTGMANSLWCGRDYGLGANLDGGEQG